MSCLNSILCGVYILGSYAHLPPLLHPWSLPPSDPRDIYYLAFLLTLNLPFEASSFPSLLGIMPHPLHHWLLPFLWRLASFVWNTPLHVCLSVITLTLVIPRSLPWCLSCTHILKPPLPFQFKSVVLPLPALVRSLFLCRVASLSFCLISPLPS